LLIIQEALFLVNVSRRDTPISEGFTVAAEYVDFLEYNRIYNNIAYTNYISVLGFIDTGDSATHPMNNIRVIN
jgi:hypothetical protein